MTREHWFLPETPDVLGLLRHQIAVTIDGLDAVAAWAGGDTAAIAAVHAAEPAGDTAKRELLTALRAAFVTPLEPEDVFALSRGIDRVLNHACDLVDESQAMETPPDARTAEMARLVGQAVRRLDEAISHLGTDGDDATRAADAAIRSVRELEQVYLAGMAELLATQDRTERIARRELYRQCSRIGETLVDVAERVVYAVVKQS